MTIRYINTQNQKKNKNINQTSRPNVKKKKKVRKTIWIFFLVRENIKGRPNALLSKLGRVPRFYSPE